MRKYAVRLRNVEAQWLQHQASCQGMTSSEYVRDLLRAQMHKPDFLSYAPSVHQIVANKMDRKYLNTVLMSYKLLEQLVLQLPAGKTLTEEAYAETLILLKKLRVYPEPQFQYNLVVNFDLLQAEWLEKQASLLYKRPSFLIRKLLLWAIAEGGDHAFCPHFNLAQQESIKAALLSCELLQNYIRAIYDNGPKIIRGAYEKAEKLSLELD